ncbi:MAG TPA: RluA family pseudouridine synthase [Candidatus Dormibacteraeota bacterium]|nr:RluA family pseudouridine synthase [Candidatus Dormibacteraeota bacterium]
MSEGAGTDSTALRLDLRVMREQRVSRSAAQSLIAGGHVRVNDRPAKSGQRVDIDDEVVVVIPSRAAAPRESAGPEVPLTVVYEDDALAVIDKPAGLVVHPAPGHPAGTLADGLRQRGATWSQLGGDERPGIVHRLDRDTSGLLVVAKTEAAHRSLSLQLQRRTLGRVYWALAHGTFREATGRIEAPIGRDPGHRQRMAVVDGGRAAITDFAVAERMRRLTRLEVRLRSGRTHQIRVHLASIGHPIAGDAVYGRRGDTLCARPALHAQRISFLHPDDNRVCEFESPLPPALVGALAAAAEVS